MKPKVLEKDVQRSILQLLALKSIFHIRMNTGAAVMQNANGKRRFMRFGTPGCADIYAATHDSTLWIECKGSSGKESEDQVRFQKQVETLGHVYMLAYSVDDVLRLFEEV